MIRFYFLKYIPVSILGCSAMFAFLFVLFSVTNTVGFIDRLLGGTVGAFIGLLIAPFLYVTAIEIIDRIFQ